MSDLTPFDIDLAAHEQQRVAAVLAAVGDQLDLHTMYYNECDATRTLYSGLDVNQRAVYRDLAAAGVLP